MRMSRRNSRRLYLYDGLDLWTCWTLHCLVIVLVLLINSVDMCCANLSGDSCDFYGSGLDSPSTTSRGVQPVYLRCNQGKVTWKYPRGALRVVLKHSKSDREFRGCIKVHREFSGARVYVEAHRRLEPLYSPSDDRPRGLPRCFISRHGQVALYVESEPTSDILQKDAAVFSYDLQPLPKNSRYDPLEDCRPCTDGEIVQAYCSSDFVAIGTVSTVTNNDALERTEVEVRADRVLHQTSTVFPAPGDDGSSTTLYVPRHCGARQGSGNFLFVGDVRLGEPRLRCAPRLEDWREVVRRAEREGSSPCIIKV